MPFQNRAPPIKLSDGISDLLRKKSGTKKRKSEVSKEGGSEDEDRPCKKGQRRESPSDLDTPSTPNPSPTSIPLIDTSADIDLMHPIANGATGLSPPNPTPSPTSDQSSHSTSSERSSEVNRIVEMEVDKSQPQSLQIIAKRVENNGAVSFKMASDGSWITAYELERLKKIQENKRILEGIMPIPASQLLMSSQTQSKKKVAPRQRRDRVDVSVPKTRSQAK